MKEFCHSLHHFAERTALKKKKKKSFPKTYFGIFPATARKRFSSVCKCSPPQLSRCLVMDRFSPPALTDRSGSPPGQFGPCRCSSSTLFFPASDFITLLKVRFSCCASWHTVLGCALFGGGVSSQSLFQRGRFGAAHADLREARGVRRQVLLQHGCPGTPPSLPLLRSSAN